MQIFANIWKTLLGRLDDSNLEGKILTVGIET